ncbi:hypothetical protein CFRS1_v015263 [Colletotrichum fructicola]|nr:hypothetical protein CFRS1_v015263 [Colletotrichum fructicola]
MAMLQLISQTGSSTPRFDTLDSSRPPPPTRFNTSTTRFNTLDSSSSSNRPSSTPTTRFNTFENPPPSFQPSTGRYRRCPTKNTDNPIQYLRQPDAILSTTRFNTSDNPSPFEYRFKADAPHRESGQPDAIPSMTRLNTFKNPSFPPNRAALRPDVSPSNDSTSHVAYGVLVPPAIWLLVCSNQSTVAHQALSTSTND